MTESKKKTMTYRGKPLKVVSSVRVNGEWVVLDDLPPEKQAEIKAYLKGEFVDQMSKSLSSRPDEARAVLKELGV